MAKMVVNIRGDKGKRITIARAENPAAHLVAAPKRKRELPADDPLLNLAGFGFDGSGCQLTNAEIDRTIYRA